jgi:hypothetical protein
MHAGRRQDRHVRCLLSLALLAMTAGCSTSAAERCFAPGTEVPTTQSVRADASLGQSTRDLATALLDRHLDGARALLTRDPRLATTRVGKDMDMLTVALASCEPKAVDLLLQAGAPADGLVPGVPLTIALRAQDPWFATRLLDAGASPNPRGNPLGPMTTAIALGSAGGVRLLLDHRTDLGAIERTGNTALLTALDMDQFAIAELLVARGADVWAIDSSGGNFGTSVTRPMVSTDPAQVAAQRRLAARLPAIGWPSPPPDPRAVRTMVLAGEWPPAAARGKGRVPDAVLAIMRRNAGPSRNE